MKKVVAWGIIGLIIIMGLFATFSNREINATEMKVIPNEAIRLRILANSDQPGDQALKRRVRDRVNESITNWVKDIRDINEGRRVIKEHLPQIEQIVEETLKEAGSNQSYTVIFNKHVQFPTKMYGDMVYPAGEYEAILITLGKGEGANWWCVLFPPLCFMDFSNGEAIASPEPVESNETKKLPSNLSVAEDNKKEEVQVRFFLKDVIDSMLK